MSTATAARQDVRVPTKSTRVTMNATACTCEFTSSTSHDLVAISSLSFSWNLCYYLNYLSY